MINWSESDSQNIDLSSFSFLSAEESSFFYFFSYFRVSVLRFQKFPAFTAAISLRVYLLPTRVQMQFTKVLCK